MAYSNYLFYIFVLLILITFIIWLWLFYQKKEPVEEEVYYEYVEEDQVKEIESLNILPKKEEELKIVQ